MFLFSGRNKAMVKKISNQVLNVLVILVAACVVSVLVGAACGMKPYVVMSGSMEPKIQTGSICFINENVAYDRIKENDVIAFQTSAGAMVTHRMIGITEEGFETKGDNNDVSDGVSTTEANYCGKNVFHVPYVGYGVQYLKTTRGKIIGITVLVCIVIASFMTYSKDETKTADEELE